MNKEEKVKNIIAFLAILFGESKVWHDEIMEFHPDYIMEKLERYIYCTGSESEWGLHPSLRKSAFEPYCAKWKIPVGFYNFIE